jgi:HSP20 family protein
MIQPYTPFDGIDQFFGRMGRGFELMGSAESVDHIAVDVADDGEQYQLTADLPGFDRDKIDLTVDDSVVTIHAEHNYDHDETSDDGSYLHRERRSASVQRRVRLPDGVDEEAVTASYHNGVLTVELPKRSSVAIEDGRRIDIE